MLVVGRAFLLCWILWTTSSSSLLGQPLRQSNTPRVPIRRIDSELLRIPVAGWALITSQGHWEELWRDYGSESQTDDGAIHIPSPPSVDFARFEVLAVSFGPTSGCSNREQYVRSVRDSATARIAVITPYESVSEITCGMITEPVDLVLLPRSGKSIRPRLGTGFDNARWKLPPPAIWWVVLSGEAARDSGTTPVEHLAYAVSRRVLPRDSTLPPEEYRLLAAASYASHDWTMHGKLRRNPRAMTDKATVAWLAADSRQDDVHALQLAFLDRFGLEVASDSQAPLPWLKTLVTLVGDAATRGPDGKSGYADVAVALARNVEVFRDSLLAGQLTWRVQWSPEAHALACQAYLQRYPETLVTERDRLGAPRSTLRANCPPPSPTSPVSPR